MGLGAPVELFATIHTSITAQNSYYSGLLGANSNYYSFCTLCVCLIMKLIVPLVRDLGRMLTGQGRTHVDCGGRWERRG